MELEMVENWRDGSLCDPPCGDEDHVAEAEKMVPPTPSDQQG